MQSPCPCQAAKRAVGKRSQATDATDVSVCVFGGCRSQASKKTK